MAITLANDTITLTLIAGDKGSTASKAYTITDLYNAAIENFWNIEKSGDSTKGLYSYNIPYRIYIAANTYFKIENCNVIFTYYNSSRPHLLSNGSTSYITISRAVLRHDLNMNGDTCSINLFNATITNSSILDFYGQTYNSGCNISSSLLRGWITLKLGATYNNCIIYPNANGNCEINSAATIENCLMFTGLRTTYMPTNTIAKFKNLRIDNSLPFVLNTATYNYTNKFINLVDCWTKTKNYTYTPSSLTGKTITVNYYSTFSFNIKNAENSELTIYDKDINIVYNTTLDSTTGSTEVLYYQIYCETPNPVLITNFQPFKVVINKDNYEDLIIEDINIVEGQPTILRGQLVKTPDPIYINQELNGSINNENINGNISTNKITGKINVAKVGGNIK